MCNINWSIPRNDDIPYFMNWKGMRCGSHKKRHEFHVYKSFSNEGGTSLHENQFGDYHELEIWAYDLRKRYLITKTFFLENFDNFKWHRHHSPSRGYFMTKVVPYYMLEEIKCGCKKEPTHGQGTIF